MKIQRSSTTQQPGSSALDMIGKGAMLLSAATALLPVAMPAHADLAPEKGIVAFKYLDYSDWQPGDERIRVRAPSVMVMMPIAGAWSVSGTYTSDSVSGASPAYHSRQLTSMEDLRRAIDLRLTHYMQRGTVTVGSSYSNESDYISRGFSVQGTLSTEDKNTTFNAGMGVSNDDINPNNLAVVGEKKHVTDWIVGVTQIFTVRDIVQLNLGYSKGNGYFSDPYKAFDERPRGRDHSTIQVRWNHHFDQLGGSSHVSYRYYTDTYGIRAHTLATEYVQPLSHGWTVTPLLRYYTQTAADFYLEALPNANGLPTFPDFDARYYSEDQRLSEYGAFTVGMKVAKQLDENWTVDAKLEQYEQRSEWALNSGGSTGIAPFRYRSLQFGISRRF